MPNLLTTIKNLKSRLRERENKTFTNDTSNQAMEGEYNHYNFFIKKNEERTVFKKKKKRSQIFMSTN